MQSHEPGLSVCICTRDRPVELERVLASIERGRSQPDAVLVSDDGEQTEKTREVCERFAFVQYFPGPRRGLCANRNAVIARATTPYVSLSDDDAVFLETFISRLRELLPTLQPKTILTGKVFEDGGYIVPNNPSFLGHFGKEPEGHFRNVNLNCNCFPRAALLEEPFDERLKYGYEDMDLCARLLRDGYEIQYVPDLVNGHAPPPRPEQQNAHLLALREQARFQTSFKRHLLWEGKPHMALLYLLVAPAHRVLHDLVKRRFADLPRIPGDVALAVSGALRERKRNRPDRDRSL